MSMNEHEKKRHTVWLPEDIWNEVERLYQDDNCTSRNEFVEKALRFYVGYLHTDKSSAFLPRVLLDVLEGSLGVFCGRVGKLMFNLAVEHCITNHLMAEDVDLNAEDYRKLRGYSVREVTETQGSFSFRNALWLHRKW